MSHELKALFEEEEISQEDFEVMQEDVTALVKDKGVSLIHVDRKFEFAIANVDAEIKRLEEIKKKAAERQAKFHTMVKNGLQALDMKKIETDFGTIALRKSEAVSIDNEAEIPIEYMNEKIIPEKITVKPDKTAIKKAIKAGKAVPGATLETRYKINIK